MSATPDSTFTSPEQLIANLHRQLAECRAERDECKAERDEALAQQTASAEVLQVINSSPCDLKPVFDAILEKAHTLCAVSHGGLALYDNGTYRLGASRGYPQALVERLRLGYTPHSSHPMWRLLEEEAYVHIHDLATIEDPTAKAVVELAGIRTTLFLALRREKTFLGMITAARDRVAPFSDKEIALLENLGARTVRDHPWKLAAL